jgi:hypothetical protein
MDWLSDQPYTGEEEPMIPENSDSRLSCPVPGYWEDMIDLFCTTSLHTKIRWNPLYTLRRYPQAGYVPDMYLPNPVGCFVYQRSVRVDAPPDADSELYIGGAQNTVSAWINGRYLGRHEGYSTPFSFPVPSEGWMAGENRITLVVSNHRLAGYLGRPVSGLSSRTANECTGGIWGDVELRTYPGGLRDLWVSTEPDCSGFVLHTIGGKEKKKSVRILDGSTCLYAADIAAGEDACRISSDGFTLWTPDTPKLYTAEVSIEGEALSARFGIRRLTAVGTKLYLNGEPYFFRGTCEHMYQPVTVHPTRNKAYYFLPPKYFAESKNGFRQPCVAVTSEPWGAY